MYIFYIGGKMNTENNNKVSALDRQESLDQKMKKNKLANLIRNKIIIISLSSTLCSLFLVICSLFYISMRHQIYFFLYGEEDYIIIARLVFLLLL